MKKVRDYVTIKEASCYLGVSPNTLRNWGASGKISTCRNPMNNYRLFKRSDLEDLLRQIDASDKLPTGRRRTSPAPARKPK